MQLRTFLAILVAGLSPVLPACAADPADAKGTALPTPPAATDKMETATLAAGCFWCTEAVFQRIKGILKVDSGYTGGKIENPTYRQVCEGDTGHAEGIRIEFDPSVISYEKVLRLFFEQHDPTTLNRQGNDAGTQYRSAIFYHSDAQKATAEKVKEELDKSGHYSSPIVTEITKAGVFYKAEEYHQNYFTLNKDKNPYCRVVILPKLKKLGIEAKEPETKP